MPIESTYIDPREFIPPLDAAVAEVFECMLGLACNLEMDNIDTEPLVKVEIRVSGVLQGGCLLSLSSAACRAATSALLGEDGEQSACMRDDAARELCNLIIGCWKSKLGPRFSEATISVPSILEENLTSYQDESQGVHRNYSFLSNHFRLQVQLTNSSFPHSFMTEIPQ